MARDPNSFMFNWFVMIICLQMLNIIGKYKNILGKKAREEETELKILVYVEFCTSNGDTSYIWENQNTKDLHNKDST